MRVHRVAIPALDEVMPLDLAIPAQIFSARETPYQTTVCTSTRRCTPPGASR